jgi:hypothetical protein
MNRRDLIRRLAATAGGSLAANWLDAVVASADPQRTPFESRLGPDERAMIRDLAEMIIPRTGTPGAIEAGVPEFIDRIVSTWCTDLEREALRAGLAQLDESCREQSGSGFIDSDAATRIAALTAQERAATGYAPPQDASVLSAPEPGAPFFYRLKQLVVLGYYTSEVGATEELAYNPVPGRYDGDYDFAEIGRQWSF